MERHNTQKNILLVVTSSADHRGIIHVTCPSPYPTFSIKTVNCYTFGDPNLLRCYITSNGKQSPTFQRIIVPSSSSSPRNLIPVLDLLDPEDEGGIILQTVGNYVSINGVMSQKTWLFINTITWAQNLTSYNSFCRLKSYMHRAISNSSVPISCLTSYLHA